MKKKMLTGWGRSYSNIFRANQRGISFASTRIAEGENEVATVNSKIEPVVKVNKNVAYDRILELRIQGFTIKNIARILNNEGVRTARGKTWTEGNLCKIASRLYWEYIHRCNNPKE